MVEDLKEKVLEILKTEVVAKAKRRQYTAEYKLRILREVDACQITYHFENRCCVIWTLAITLRYGVSAVTGAYHFVGGRAHLIVNQPAS